MSEPKPTAPRHHPDRRAQISGLNTAILALRGTPTPEPPQKSYYTPALIQCTLPHSDPKVRDWVRTNGDFTLIVSSGVNKKGTPYGVPYGSFPRLVLAYIITHVVQTKERRIPLTNHFSGFLKEIGYTGNHKGQSESGKRIQDQLKRLLYSNISFEKNTGDEDQGGMSRRRADVARDSTLWWDYKNPDQQALFDSHIDLTEEFYNSILENPVPLQTKVLAALKKSTLALDVYMWVSYRLFTMQAADQEQVTLGYGRLQEQFGTGISEANYRSFRREFRLALEKVAEHWKLPDGKERLNYDLHQDGLTLFRSPLLINVPKSEQAKKIADDKAAQILAAKQFDELTIREARQVAGELWDVKYLQQQYFAWIERTGTTPKNPKAHFFTFIKQHRQRNER